MHSVLTLPAAHPPVVLLGAEAGGFDQAVVDDIKPVLSRVLAACNVLWVPKGPPFNAVLESTHNMVSLVQW